MAKSTYKITALCLFVIVNLLISYSYIFKTEHTNYQNRECLDHHRPCSQKKYTIVSVALPNFTNKTMYIDENHQPINVERCWAYIFHLPLIASLWQRINITLIISITVDYKNASSNAIRQMDHVVSICKMFGAIIIYFDAPSHMKVRLSQNLRITVAQLGIIGDDDILFTDDADMWPLNANRYVIPHGKRIYVANAFCCGHFEKKSKSGIMKNYREFPMSTIGMDGHMWKSVFGKLIDGQPNKNNVYSFKSLKPLIKRLETFSNSTGIYSSQHAGVAWSLDQLLASYEIQEYISGNKTRRNILELKEKRCARIHQGWKEYVKIVTRHECIETAHMAKDPEPWRIESWQSMLPIIMHIMAPTSKTISILDTYRDTFARNLN